MRIGITAFFRGSAFSGSLPQVAVYLSRVLTGLGHEVEFVIPQDSDDWFIDCSGAALCPRVKLESGKNIQMYNLLIEVVWFLPPDIRLNLAQKTAMFYHYPPVFYDIEGSVYPLSALNRDFTGVDVIWSWAHFVKTDLDYLAFLSRKPVFTLPYLWDPVFSDLYLKDNPIVVGSGDHEVVICESNESNTSNCTLPLTILSEIYKQKPVKLSVLNSDQLIQRPFFVNNILKNLNVEQTDISGNFRKRIRLPDLLRSPTVIISHQRWRPIKYMLLDALYLGIPIIHNCEMIKDISGGQFYTLNRIGQAIKGWNTITGGQKITGNNRSILLSRFGPKPDSIVALLEKSVEYVKPVKGQIQLAFFDMWVDFQPLYNTIVSALIARGISVDINQESPNLIIFGPFGSENTKEKWSGVRKIFYTGESLKPLIRSDVVLNIGFRRNITADYFRFPLWMIELNWFNVNPTLCKNPVPFSLDLLNQKPEKRSKFCAFVASNPVSVQRNTLYNIISRYKKIDSAGKLFSNMDSIEGGLGGAGGQEKKVEFYKGYKFVLACENSSSNGYATEKILHAKLAGCIPIYWGDPVIDLDFNPSAFINASSFTSEEALLDRIKMIDENDEEWLKIAASPLIRDLDKCRERLNSLADVITKVSVLKEVDESHVSYEAFSALINSENSIVVATTDKAVTAYPMKELNNTATNVIVTCCNHKFVICAIKLVLSSDVPVYIWGLNLSAEDKRLLNKAGGIVLDLDTSWNPNGWSDFWSIEHYAWKPLVISMSSKMFRKDTNILYLDSGIEITNSLSDIWSKIGNNDVFVLEMEEHKMKMWSHPTFCSILKMTEDELNAPQYSANIVGFKAGGKYDSMFYECFQLACQKAIVSGKKWHQYSPVCFGHRHDQSILSLLGYRSSVIANSLCDFVGEKSKNNSKRLGLPFYVHRGLWKFVAPIAENIEEVFVINLEHRKDRLEKFYGAHPFLKDYVYRVDAFHGNKLILDKNMVDLFRNNDFKWKKGVIGCALSHYKLWTELNNSELSNSYLILEDDVVLDPEFLYKWRAIAHLMPSDTDIVFLGGVLPPNKHALPAFTEPVNSAFAKVKMMQLGASMRRYFHFCTYSYIITKQGAKKLCKLIEEKGIFTSIDHMMVNHGDSLLNIYFTTPLLAGCFQDQDPVYQNADFNDFNRVDKFDSEIWNNVEHFSVGEIESIRSNTINFVYFDELQKNCIEQQWLEEIFSKKIVWVDASSVKEPGYYVIYYQHTTAVAIIEGWVNRHLDCNLVLFHASDENCSADVSIYKHSAIKTVFRNYWRPECISDKVIHLPLGYLNDTCRDSRELNRIYTWSFAGAMDRKGRSEQLQSLCQAVPNHKIHCTKTWNSPDNLGKSDYVKMLRQSKIVPALAGFYNVESYRFYEALENGAIPIIPLDEKNSYTNIFGGSLNPPLLAMKDMNMLGSVVSMLEANNKVLATVQLDLANWWTGYKLYLKKLIESRVCT